MTMSQYFVHLLEGKMQVILALKSQISFISSASVEYSDNWGDIRYEQGIVIVWDPCGRCWNLDVVWIGISIDE